MGGAGAAGARHRGRTRAHIGQARVGDAGRSPIRAPICVVDSCAQLGLPASGAGALMRGMGEAYKGMAREAHIPTRTGPGRDGIRRMIRATRCPRVINGALSTRDGGGGDQRMME